MMASISPTTPELLLTRDEAAAALKLCTRTVDKLIRNGELPVVRIGRRVLVSVSAIEAWISRQEAANSATPTQQTV
jgi:excisionase family DNA binding protein